MNRLCEPHLTEPEAGPVSPWLEASLRAKDPNAFLMSLGETEFAVLLAELDARRLSATATRKSGHQRRKGRLKRNQIPRPF